MEGGSVFLILNTVCIWWHFYCSLTGTLKTRLIFLLNPSPPLPSQKQILLLMSPTVPRHPSNMQFVTKMFMLGCWWWLVQELISPACYCKAVQERGSAGQTGLVLEGLLRRA